MVVEEIRICGQNIYHMSDNPTTYIPKISEKNELEESFRSEERKKKKRSQGNLRVLIFNFRESGGFEKTVN